MKLNSLFLAGLLLAIAGCGGNTNDRGFSPYAGLWFGDYESRDLGMTGVVDIRIYTDGTVDGSSTDDGTGDVGIIEGYVDEDGYLEAMVDYPREAPFSLFGFVDIDSRGHLVGDLVQDFGSSEADFYIDLVED